MVNGQSPHAGLSRRLAGRERGQRRVLGRAMGRDDCVRRDGGVRVAGANALGQTQSLVSFSFQLLKKPTDLGAIQSGPNPQHPRPHFERWNLTGECLLRL